MIFFSSASEVIKIKPTGSVVVNVSRVVQFLMGQICLFDEFAVSRGILVTSSTHSYVFLYKVYCFCLIVQ